MRASFGGRAGAWRMRLAPRRLEVAADGAIRVGQPKDRQVKTAVALRQVLRQVTGSEEGRVFRPLDGRGEVDESLGEGQYCRGGDQLQTSAGVGIAQGREGGKAEDEIAQGASPHHQDTSGQRNLT